MYVDDFFSTDVNGSMTKYTAIPKNVGGCKRYEYQQYSARSTMEWFRSGNINVLGWSNKSLDLKLVKNPWQNFKIIDSQNFRKLYSTVVCRKMAFKYLFKTMFIFLSLYNHALLRGVITWNPNIQLYIVLFAVMWQCLKMFKWHEYFCKALYMPQKPKQSNFSWTKYIGLFQIGKIFKAFHHSLHQE